MSSQHHTMDPDWPPGTVRIEGESTNAVCLGIHSTKPFLNTDISASSEESVVILEPKPSTDPNDPLVSMLTTSPGEQHD